MALCLKKYFLVVHKKFRLFFSYVKSLENNNMEELKARIQFKWTKILATQEIYFNTFTKKKKTSNTFKENKNCIDKTHCISTLEIHRQ